MFRLFQIDPETAAIHVNIGAIEGHRYSEALRASLDAFRGNHLDDLLRTLYRLPDSDERAHVAAFTSQLIHELRHAVDLLLTPYGFHRIRTGFEFYEMLPPFLATDECKIFPFSSWVDDGMRRLLGGEGTETSYSYQIAQLAHNRRLLIEADNHRFKHESGPLMSLGGDAILEALAFGFQVEWLQHPRFDTHRLRKLMPYAFPTEVDDGASEAELTQFDLTYRWHYPLMGVFTQERTPAAASLMYNILFASLCGSLFHDAKPRALDYKTASSVPRIGTRDVSDRMPSRRLQELLGWFGNYVENGHSIPDAPMDGWELVNEAARSIWHRSVLEEIAADVAADEALLGGWRALAPEGLFSVRPCAAFADLCDVRRALFAALVNSPELILRPLRLAEVADEHLSLPICYFYPEGTEEEMDGTKRVIERLVPLPVELATAWKVPEGSDDPDKFFAHQVLYSSWEMKVANSAAVRPQGTRAWDVIMGEFAPSYKLALYGHRYRTMLEYDLVCARDRLATGQSDVRWDDFYLDVEDISASWEYFHFYDLKVANCDACGDETTADDSIIASSATLRSSESFMESFQDKHGITRYRLLDLDWSPWLICSSCRTRFLS